MHDRQTLLDDRSPAGSAADSVACQFCDQRVDPHETVSVSLGDDGREREVCQFCVTALFDDWTATNAANAATDADDSGSARDRPGVRSRAAGRASDVSWSAPRATGGGVLGALLRSQFASLSLLWAIHRTNVRLVERVLDEVDVQTLVGLWLSLSATALVALAAL